MIWMVVWMRELNHKESWAPKYWCFRTVVLKTIESLLDCKEIQPVHPKDQSWIFIGRTDAETETPILWPPDAKDWLIGKDPDAGKDWRQEEKGTTEDDMAGWYRRFDGHEFKQAPGDGEGQGSWCAALLGVTKSRTWPSDWTGSQNDKNNIKHLFCSHCVPGFLSSTLLKGTYLIFTIILQGRYCHHTHFTVGKVGEGMLVGQQWTEQPCIVRNYSLLYAPLDAYAGKKSLFITIRNTTVT